MKKLAVLFILSLFVLALVGCVEEEAGGPAVGEDSIIIALEAEPTSLDPTQISDYNSSRACMEMYDNLLRFKDASTDLEPSLATEWEISEDGLEYTFALRDDVTFHDGTAFNADVVKFNIDRQLDPTHPYHDTGDFAYADTVYGMVDSVEVLDEFSVKIILSEPYAPFLSNLGMHAAAMVSPEAIMEHGKDISLNPVGTGPFKFVS